MWNTAFSQRERLLLQGVKISLLQRNTLTAALRVTIPVMMGYLVLGLAFGLMMNTAGYGPGWAVLMSLVVYAGSAQILGVGLLAAHVPLGQIALLTLLLNFRHLAYGLSMLEKFRGMGWRKFYMIFSLSDETYALLASAKAPEGVEERDFLFSISLLDQSYWVVGSLLGSVLGASLRLNTTGVDFAMTALFVVIAVGQWRERKNRLPAALGYGATVGGLLLAGRQGMLVPALGIIVAALALARPRLDPEKEGA